MKIDTDDKVSIIVPIFRVENELDRCLQSLLNQTYTNIEIILIDDGSPDNCPMMCDEYAKEDNRVKVIHKKNGGVSDARNYGLDIAKGKYIAFVDPDDWVDSDFIQILLANLKKEDADISIIGYTMVWDNGRTRRFTNDNQYSVFEKEEAIRELFIQRKFQCMSCQKLYKATVFQEIRFPLGITIYEDVAISLLLFQRCNRVVFSGKSKYFYYQRRESAVHVKFNSEKLHILKYCEEIFQYSESLHGKYNIEVHTFYLKIIMEFLLELYDLDEKFKYKTLIYKLKKDIKKQWHYIFFNPYLEFRKKVVLIFLVMPFPKKLLVKLWKNRWKVL